MVGGALQIQHWLRRIWQPISLVALSLLLVGCNGGIPSPTSQQAAPVSTSSPTPTASMLQPVTAPIIATPSHATAALPIATSSRCPTTGPRATAVASTGASQNDNTTAASRTAQSFTGPCVEQGQFQPVAFTPDSQWFAVGGAQGVTLYAAATATVAWTLPTSQLPVGLIFTPDSHLLIIALANSQLLFCRTSDGVVIRQAASPSATRMAAYLPLYRTPLAISSDGHWLILGYPTLLALWDLPRQDEQPTKLLDSAATTAVAFSADGQWLWTVAANRRDGGNTNALSTLYRWQTGDWQAEFWPLPDYGTLPVFAANAQLLVFVTTNLTLWDLTGQPTLARQTSFTTPPTALAVAADGSLILGGAAGSIALWRSSDLYRLALYPGVQQPLATVALSPDNMRIVAVDRAGTISIWSR